MDPGCLRSSRLKSDSGGFGQYLNLGVSLKRRAEWEYRNCVAKMFFLWGRLSGLFFLGGGGVR